jgi:16S rRNA processing protein RimM
VKPERAAPAARPDTAADTPPAPPAPGDAIEVGRVLGAWGVKGAIKVLPFSGDPQALFATKRWYLDPPRADGPLRIVQAREQGDAIVATAQDIDDRDAAQALAGARVLVPRASFPTPDEGEFYWVDLIGLDVVTREGIALGRVTGLIETGPHCVLRIRPEAADPKAEDCLIPFVDAYVDAVDREARRITVDWQPDY